MYTSPQRVNATVLWPEVGCPFAVVAKFAVETLPDNTPGKIGDRGDARTDYLYLMSLQGCVEHSPACRAAQPMRRERKTKQVRCHGDAGDCALLTFFWGENSVV